MVEMGTIVLQKPEYHRVTFHGQPIGREWEQTGTHETPASCDNAPGMLSSPWGKQL
jgi:hypothetical protein